MVTLTRDWQEAKEAFDRGDKVELRVYGARETEFSEVTEFHKDSVILANSFNWYAYDYCGFYKEYRVTTEKCKSVDKQVMATMEQFAKEFPFMKRLGGLLKIKEVQSDCSYRVVDIYGEDRIDYGLGDDDVLFLTLDEAVDEMMKVNGREEVKRRLEAL